MLQTVILGLAFSIIHNHIYSYFELALILLFLVFILDF